MNSLLNAQKISLNLLMWYSKGKKHWVKSKVKKVTKVNWSKNKVQMFIQ